MHKVIITSEKFEGSLVLELDDSGVVKQFLNNAEMDSQQLDYLSANFPMTLDSLNALISKSKSMNAKLVETDLSFLNFWNTYGYKVGNKKKCETSWNKLTDAEKLLVFESLPAYNFYLMTHPNIERVYPERYLSQRRFENEYKVK